MNERIQTLALECGAWQQVYDQQRFMHDHNFDIEKFAKLIVQECLQQCEQVRDDAAAQKKSQFLTESGKMLYEGVYGGANNCGYAIQQHFGVEP